MTALAPVQTTTARVTSQSATGARLLQKKCACGAAKSGVGDECRECQGTRLQRKLAVGSTNDPLEAEADRVAAQVMSRPALPLGVSHAPPRIQRLSHSAGQGGETAPPSVERVLASPGRPLEPTLQADMEQRFGYDFSRVRVHTDARAAQSAQDVDAHAYTAGHSIVFGAGRYAPRTQEGRRLIAHELTHVRQQSPGRTAEMVQRQPTQDDVLQFMLSLGGRRFVFWAKSHGKWPTAANAGQITALHDEYRKVETTKDVLEAFDQAQKEMDTRTLATRREAARAAEDAAAETKPERSQKQREQRRHQTRAGLQVAIKKAWNERSKYEDPHYGEQARFDAAHRVALPKALSRQHWKSNEHRWVYIRKYYREYSILYPESFAGSFDNEDELVLYAALAEESYVEKAAQNAEAAELGAYRKGLPRAARTETIKKLAAQRPMNPLENFEPGIHDYSPYLGQPGSVDVDVQSADFDAKSITIVYKDGKRLEIPLGQTNLIFALTPVDPAKVLRVFTRRHKQSQRLIPFVIYGNTAGIDLDALPEDELALMGWARFDPSLTPIVARVLSPEFKFQKATAGALKAAALTATGLPLRQLGVPLVSGTIGVGTNILASAGRTSLAAARSISSTVATYGYSPVAATILGRQAMTYYLTHGLQINLAAMTLTDVVVTLGGGDTGLFINPGDEVAIAVVETKAGVKAAQRAWKELDFTVAEVNLAKGEATLHRTGAPRAISEETAKEFNYGNNLAVFPKPSRQGKVKPPIGSAAPIADSSTASIAAKAPSATSSTKSPHASPPRVIPEDVERRQGQLALERQQQIEALKKERAGLEPSVQELEKRIDRLEKQRAKLRETSPRERDKDKLKNTSEEILSLSKEKIKRGSPAARIAQIDDQIRKLDELSSLPRLGGSHSNVSKKSIKFKREANHMPAFDAYSGAIDLKYGEGPSILMLADDHKKMASTGNGIDAINWRNEQKALIDQGDFLGAFEKDVSDLHAKGLYERYESAVLMARRYLLDLPLQRTRPR